MAQAAGAGWLLAGARDLSETGDMGGFGSPTRGMPATRGALHGGRCGAAPAPGRDQRKRQGGRGAARAASGRAAAAGLLLSRKRSVVVAERGGERIPRDDGSGSTATASADDALEKPRYRSYRRRDRARNGQELRGAGSCGECPTEAIVCGDGDAADQTPPRRADSAAWWRCSSPDRGAVYAGPRRCGLYKFTHYGGGLVRLLPSGL